MEKKPYIKNTKTSQTEPLNEDTGLYANVLKLQTQIMKRLDRIERYIKFQVYIKSIKYIFIVLVIVLGIYFAVPFFVNIYEQYTAILWQVNESKGVNLLNIFK